MVEIRLLGQIDVQLDGTPIEISSRPAQLLLAYLALHPGVEHRREKLAGLIWPETSEEHARNNLRHALWRIRKAIGTSRQTGRDYILADTDTIAFDKEADYWLDALSLEKQTAGRGSSDDLIGVVSLYRGEFLPGIYDDWVILERERLQTVFEHRMQQLMDRLVENGRWPDILEWGERWIALGQTPEPAYRALMVAHSRLGDISSVAAVYQRCIASLRKELGVDPSEQTRALYGQLLKGGTPLGAPAAAIGQPGPAVREAPAHRPTPPHNLPLQPTPFIGRSEELAEIAQRLNDPACRLLNLNGPGGIGKTRLALQAASEHIEAFRDGVYFVPLAPVSSAEFLVPAIADSLKFEFYGQESPKTQVLNYLREKEMLLVSDNFEHLLEGVGLLEEILTTAPGVKILATSRERLHLQWEWLLEIEGLDYPKEESEEVEDYSAVKLFVQTARRVHSRFSLSAERPAVVRICQLADGVPLAIELAAAWVRVLSCADIARQIERNLDVFSTSLRDVPDRHRSIQAVFEHSWNLLSQEEQRVFRQLSVFEAGFRREAAEKVAGAPLSLLFSLADKSFLRRTPTGRYEMHELLRQYATLKLVEVAHEGETAYQKMAHYCLEFARAYQHDYAELEQEWSNLLAGLRVAFHAIMWPLVIDYANTLTDAWFARGRFSDARRGYQLACEAAQALEDQQALAASLRRWGQACIEQGDYDEAEDHLTDSLQLCRQLGDQHGVAGAQLSLARIAIEKSNHREAERLLAECQLIREQIGDVPGIGEALYHQAWVQYYYGNYEKVDLLGKKALDIQQAIGDKVGCVRTLRLLAQAALIGMNDFSLAEKHCLRAINLCEALQDQGELAVTLYTLAEASRRRGDLRLARQQAETSLSLLKRMGDRQSQARAFYRLSLIDADARDYDLALQEGSQSLSLCRELQDASGTVYVLSHLGDILMNLHRPDQASAMWSEALDTASKLQHPLTESLRQRLGQIQP